MYGAQEMEFSSLNEVTALLGRRVIEGTVPLGIIAGNFLLMYDPDQDNLSPALWDTNGNAANKSRVRREFVQEFGDFPVTTFGLGCDLVQEAQKVGRSARIILAVNDHEFQSARFQPEHQSLIKGRAGALRKRFYRESPDLPAAFAQILTDRQVMPDEVILRNDLPARTKQDILPKKSIFFSETALRNRFDTRTAAFIKKDSRFVWDGTPKSYRLALCREGQPNVELTEGGTCGCPGEVVEFVLTLGHRGLRDLVFFVPWYCRAAVDAGIAAAMHLVDQDTRVLTVAGIGVSAEIASRAGGQPFKVVDHRRLAGSGG